MVLFFVQLSYDVIYSLLLNICLKITKIRENSVEVIGALNIRGAFDKIKINSPETQKKTLMQSYIVKYDITNLKQKIELENLKIRCNK